MSVSLHVNPEPQRNLQPRCRLRAVLFDLDGTLLDTLRDLAESTNAALVELGFAEHPVDAYRTFVGEGMTELMRRTLPVAARDARTIERGVAVLKRHYSTRWSQYSRPYDGVPGLLDGLVARGVRAAIISNKADEFTQLIAAHYFGRWPLAAVRGSRPPAPLKPDPTVALEVVATLGVAPAAAAFVGDTRVDMETAVAAGMVPIGVLWGFRDAEELRTSGARHLVAKPNDILSLVDATR